MKKRNNMKKYEIMVPVDFTNEAKVGLSSAVNMAKDTGARLNLLHIVEDAGSSSFEPSGDITKKNERLAEHNRFMAELIRKRKIDLTEFLHDYDTTRLEITNNVMVGQYQDAMRNYLDEHSIDLIVMGTSGETTLFETFKGNHAARALRVSKIPVLTLKNYTKNLFNTNLMLLLDLEDYTMESLENLRNFAILFSMNVHLVYLKDSESIEDNAALEQLKDIAKENGFNKFTVNIFDRSDKIQFIESQAKELNIDIVASIATDDSSFIRLLYGSDTEKFINELSIPVLSISE